jgi:hypothetical protein
MKSMISEKLSETDKKVLYTLVPQYQGIFPDHAIILQNLGVTDTIQNRKALNSSLTHLIDLGFITRNYKHKRFTDKAKDFYDSRKIENGVKKINTFLHKEDNFIRFGFLIPAVACIILSFQFTKNFLIRFISGWEAVIFSIAIVGLAYGFFEMAILRLKEKRYKLFVLFALLWLTTVLPSIGSTIFGQYQGNLDFQKTTIDEQVLLYNEEIIENQRKKLNKKEKQIDEIIDRTGDPVYRVTQWIAYGNDLIKLAALEKEFENLESGLTKLLKEKNEYVIEKNIDTNEQDSFYVFLSRVSGIAYDQIDFWFSVCLGLIIDIIGPAGLALALWWRKEETNG